MHELSLMADLVDVVKAETGDRRVLTVRIEVGEASAVLLDALRQCFEDCARGTTLEGASLDIVETLGAEVRLKGVETQ